MSGDLHSPTNAGPTPEPTPTVSPSDATTQRPAGTAAPAASFDSSSAATAAAEHPEVLVGAAFAGGLITAMLLKRLGR